ncbi:hypothetical protein PMN64_33645 [Bradyrhizobium sp. UFLA01-814]|uniref:hypothetical protein n=1 Tax=Bradyrhizobium sp. UFLA01-814 TaxID=3023480 RepID=UPI00398A9370
MDIDSINVHLYELRWHTAGELGVTGPQWMILMALEDLDKALVSRSIDGTAAKTARQHQCAMRSRAVLVTAAASLIELKFKERSLFNSI